MAIFAESNIKEEVLENTRKAYMLPHNQSEIERMKCQHEWIKGSFGGLIKAPIDFAKKDQKILDSATADGKHLSCLFPATFLSVLTNTKELGSSMPVPCFLLRLS
jgi:hypothetical protein